MTKDQKSKIRSVATKIFKVTAWFLLTLVLLLIIIIFSLRIPAVQQKVTAEAVKYFSDKTGTEAAIGRLYVEFPTGIVIEELYIEDLTGDTLVYGKFINVDADLWGLLDNNFEVEALEVNKLIANIYNAENDSTFNYQFIVDAFAGSSSDSLAASDTLSDEGEAFNFSIAKADIKNSQIKYYDLYLGTKMNAAIGHFNIVFSEFDLQELIIGIEKVSLENSEGRYTILKPPLSSEPDTAASAPVQLSGETVLVDDVEFIFDDQPQKFRAVTEIGRLEANLEHIDINEQVYKADDILLHNSFVSVEQFSIQDTVAQDTIPEELEETALMATANRAIIENLSVKLYDHNYPVTEGFDPNHLWFQKVEADLEKIIFKNGYASGKINNLSALEKGGMNLRELKTDFSYDSTTSYAKDLSIITKNSTIEGDLLVKYESIASLQKDPGNLLLDIKLLPSVLHLEDLFYFQPTLRNSNPFFSGNTEKIHFEGEIDGSLDNLNLRQLALETMQSTQMKVAGHVTGLPEIETASYDIQLEALETSATDLMTVLPDTLFPATMKLPPKLSLSGTFKGTMADFTAALKLKSTYGSFSAAIEMQEDVPEHYVYDGQIDLENFNVGRLLNKEEEIGTISLKTKVKGSGFTLDNIDTRIEGTVASAIYNGYKYQGLNVNGHLKLRQFSGNISMNDPNLDFDFDGLVNLNDTVPEYSFTLDLKALDLQALNFAEEQFQIRAKVMADISLSSVQDINGTLEIDNFLINKADKAYPIDTFMLASIANEERTDISLFSKVLDAQFTGNFNLETLSEVLKQHFNRYYSFADYPDVEQLQPQQFTFEIDIKRPLFFSEILIPGLEELQPGPIEGDYNSENWSLNINVGIPKIIYNGITIDSLLLDIHSDEEYLGYETSMANIVSGNLGVQNLIFSGLVQADHINTDLIIKDDSGIDKYHLGGIFISGPDYYRYQFTPGEFVLNYKSWDIKPSNRIDIYPSGLWIKNMLLSHQDQQIKVESLVNQESDSVLSADIENFDLSLIANPEEAKENLIAGILNGSLNVSMESSKSAFTSDLNINQFSFKGDTLGTIMLKAASSGEKRYNLDLLVESTANNLKVNGYYIADSIPDMDINAKVNRLDLSTIESFTMGQLKDLKGWLTGEFKITGTTEDPDIAGSLNFNKTSFNVAYLQSKLSIDNESISFNESGISFRDFVIKDQNNQPARVDGEVLTEDYSAYQFDLEVTTDEFMLLNTTQNDNDLFYGTVGINSRARITGSAVQPDVQLDISLKDGSNLTYVIPEQEIQLQEREGIVEFFNKDLEKQNILTGKPEPGDTLAEGLTGVNLSANININRNSKLSIIIDPVTGDQLTVQGDANLTLDIKPSGDMTLTGRYEVFEGLYNLNLYGLVKRQFEISKGSYLIWTGDPLNARMDITATYKVTAVYELPGQVQESTQRAPFIVYLDIKNELLKPDISFRLGLEEGAAAAGAQAFIANVNKDENEVNAQVFYLLLFKSTKNLESYSTTGGGGNIAESTARSSASRLLSNQLNKLAGKLEGVELSLDLESYNTGDASGGNTQLELGLSKELFNERVVVKVAGNFGLEGEEAERQENVSDFAGDIRIEYKLTKDGRYRLVGFRENEYDNLLQGEVIKTGVGVIFVRDYNAFKELFKKIEKEEDNE